MKENKELTSISLSYLKDLTKAQPALIITILYIYLSIIGLIYAISFFAEFNINIISYFSLQDFLIITVSNPEVFIYGLMAVFLFFLLKTRFYSGLREGIINPPVFSHKILNTIYKPFSILSKIIFYPFINLKITIMIVILSPILFSYSSSKFQAHNILNNEIKTTRSPGISEKIVLGIVGLNPKNFAKVKLSYDVSEKDTGKKLEGDFTILMTTNNYLILFNQNNRNVCAVLRTKIGIIYYDDNSD